MSIKINGLKEHPKWYRYVEPGEEPDPRALVLDTSSREWKPRPVEKGDPYATWNFYAVPIYGPIPDGFELVEDGEWCEGMMYWDDRWNRATASSKCGMLDDAPYIRPIKPTPSERPLLTAADFMKDGPWWVRPYAGESHFYLVVGVSFEAVEFYGKWMHYKVLRESHWQRTNDGEHWEDC